MNPLIQFKRISLPLVVVTVLVCFALSIKVEAGLRGPPPTCNTSDGFQALFSITTGVSNTAVGGEALFSDTTGSNDTAVGCQALEFNIDGIHNTATGNAALASNTHSNNNTAVGYKALFSHINDDSNTAVGTSALMSDTGGSLNTALGGGALHSNTSGVSNTAVGFGALAFSTTAGGNTAVGAQALLSNITGIENIAIDNEGGSFLTTGNFNIDIGSEGVAGEGNTIRLGAAFNADLRSGQNKTFIAGIYTVTTGSTTTLPVIVDSNGQLGTTASSERFKKEIKPMDKTSEAILGFKPVTFRYKNDDKGTPQFGLIAEDVAEVNPDLVIRDQNGEIYSVRYEAVNAMLLNEFLKEHRKVEKQGEIIAKQQKQIDALTRGLQKVNDQLELRKPAPQTVLNN